MVDWKIVQNSDSYEYSLRICEEVTQSINKPNIRIGQPGSSPESATIFSLIEQTEDLTLRFLIFDNDVDTALGTAPTNSDFPSGTVKTRSQQIIWLKRYIFSYETNITYTIHGDDFSGGTARCAISTLTINKSQDDPMTAVGNLTISIGTAV